MEAALGFAIIASSVGLFAPDGWDGFLFAAILVAAVLCSYLEEERSTTREEAERMWGPDPADWPVWRCEVCEQRNAGWVLECGRCEVPRSVEVADDGR